MAKITQEVQIKIDTANAAQSVGDLKRAYKDLVSAQLEFGEGTAEFDAAARAAGELNDRLSAVKDSVKSFSNSPIENLSNSFGDLKAKVVNLDFGGLAQSFKNFNGVATDIAMNMLGISKATTATSAALRIFSAALAATGIGLIVVALGLLLSQFDDLTKAGGFIGGIFKGLSEIFEGFKQGVLGLADTLGLVDKAAADSAIARKKIRDDEKEEIDKDLAEIEALREKYRQDDLTKQEKAFEDLAKRRADEFKILEADLEKEKLAQLGQYAEIEFRKADFNEQTRIKEQQLRDKFAAEDAAEAKAKSDKAIAEAKKVSDAKAKVIADFIKKESELDAENESNLAAKELEKLNADKAAKAAALERLKASYNEQKIIQEQQVQDQLDADERKRESDRRTKEESIATAYQTAAAISNIISAEGPLGAAVSNFGSILANTAASLFQTISNNSATTLEIIGQSLEIANALVGGIGQVLKAQSEENLSDIKNEEETKIAALQAQKDAGIITQEQLAKGIENINKKARAQELTEKKKAFEQQKSIQLVQAVIGTAQGIVAASANAFPLNIAMMALAAAVGAAQIGLISAQQFPSGGGGGASAPTAPTGPAMPAAGSANQPIASFAAAGTGANLNTVGAGAPIMIENNVTISETQVTNAQTTVAGYQAGSELGDG